MPFYRFTFHSALPPHKAAATLAALTQPKKGFLESLKHAWRFSSSAEEQPWQGTVGDERFSIRRVIRYRNSFLPMIHGRFEPDGLGSQVTVTMSLHPFVILFLIFFCGQSVLITSALQASAAAPPFFYLWMPLMALAITLIGFAPEAYKARNMLIAQLAEAPPPTDIHNW